MTIEETLNREYPLIVSFGALKHGRDMSIKTISGAIVIGVKFMAVYFILYAAQRMGATMEQVLKNFSITDFTPMWTCFGMAGLLAFLALKVPQMPADLLNGTVSLSGGDAMAAAAVGGGAAAAIAGGAASLTGGAANTVGGDQGGQRGHRPGQGGGCQRLRRHHGRRG